jgi:hypothetical protein
MIELRNNLAAKISRDRIVPEPGRSAFERSERLKLLAKMDGDILKMKAATTNGS